MPSNSLRKVVKTLQYCNDKCPHNFFCEALDTGCDDNHHTYDASVDAIHKWQSGGECVEEFF